MGMAERGRGGMARKRPSRRAAVHAKPVQGGRRHLGGSWVTRPSMITSEYAVIQLTASGCQHRSRRGVANFAAKQILPVQVLGLFAH